MIHDAALPSCIRPVVVPMQQAGIWYLAASWTPGDLACIVQRLTGPGRERISSIPMAELLDAWDDTVAAFRRRGSPERVALDPALARLSQLSEAGLQKLLTSPPESIRWSLLGGNNDRYRESVTCQP